MKISKDFFTTKADKMIGCSFLLHKKGVSFNNPYMLSKIQIDPTSKNFTSFFFVNESGDFFEIGLEEVSDFIFETCSGNLFDYYLSHPFSENITYEEFVDQFNLDTTKEKPLPQKCFTDFVDVNELSTSFSSNIELLVSKELDTYFSSEQFLTQLQGHLKNVFSKRFFANPTYRKKFLSNDYLFSRYSTSYRSKTVSIETIIMTFLLDDTKEKIESKFSKGGNKNDKSI